MCNYSDQCSISQFNNFALTTSFYIGVTHSYLSHPFLCALVSSILLCCSSLLLASFVPTWPGKKLITCCLWSLNNLGNPNSKLLGVYVARWQCFVWWLLSLNTSWPVGYFSGSNVWCSCLCMMQQDNYFVLCSMLILHTLTQKWVPQVDYYIMHVSLYTYKYTTQEPPKS